MKRVRTAISVACLLLLAVLSPCVWSDAPPSLEERVATIEQVNRTAPWRESADLIDTLEREQSSLPADLAFRVDLVRARNFALAGDLDEAIATARSLLAREVDPDLRVRALSFAINVTTNVADYPTAFAYLKEALDLLDETGEWQVRVLGMASYLYLRVGEEASALNFAEKALAAARETGSARDVCMALADYGAALAEIGHAAQAEDIAHEQIAACTRAGDPVFTADGYKCVGLSLLAQELPAQAIPWLSDAREKFAAAGFTNGLRETDVNLADALLHSGGSLAEAESRVRDALPTFEAQDSWDNLELAHRLLSEIAETRGQPVEALAQLRRADAARERLDHDARERRLAFLQMQFDSQAKAREILALQADRARQQSEIDARSRTLWLQGLALLGMLLTAGLLVVLLWRTSIQRRRYREASERDGLTGLYNHPSTLRLGREMQQRCYREHKPFTVVLADIDRFKQINDRFGHPAGDAVLEAIGALLREVFPDRAVIGRSGGDEFTLLVEATLERTKSLIEELRGRIEPVLAGDSRVEYRLSFGVCAADESQATLEDVVRRADMALYEAKRGGRDRVAEVGEIDAKGRAKPGLVVVGSGIQLGRHMSARCLSEIRAADRVFVLADPAAHAMIAELRPDLVDLRVHYANGKDRRETYREMDAAIMAEVLAGKRVCAVFYGHPGVFADVPHAIIRKAREAGIDARMEPGISAEACLYADLGIDPGSHGVQSLEATQFLVEDRSIDNRSLLLLWQVALTGDTDCTRFHALPAELEKLVERLLRDYPADHEVILYEAARLPIETPRAERVRLRDLAAAHYEEHTTLVVPPCGLRNRELAARLA